MASINESKARLKELKTRLQKVNQEIHRLNDEKHQIVNEMEEIQGQIAIETIKNASECQGDFTITYPWSEDVDVMLKSIFGLEKFKEHQLETINATLNQKDTLLVMPTGAGKSLTYQIPALLDGFGLTLVISPLISLMADQVFSLNRRELIPPGSVRFINSHISNQEQTEILNQIVSNNKKADNSNFTLKLLFITPEKLVASKRLKNKLDLAYKTLHPKPSQHPYNSKRRLGRFVIDEIHCVSQWGHDFRPDYKALHILKRQYPDVPLLGLTATASIELIMDVQKCLALKADDCVIMRSNCNRKNLFYSSKFSRVRGDAAKQELLELINSKFRNQCGIVYCYSQKDTEEVSSFLLENSVSSAPYHASMEHSIKMRTHQRWMNDQIQVIIATVAFGMGIDKPDVQFVIHFCISKTIETYYQESGRAGRNGSRSECVVLYHYGDLFRIASMVYTDQQQAVNNLLKMIEYAVELRTCRRQLIGRALGDEVKPCREYSQDSFFCDNCTRDASSLMKLDVGELITEVTDLLASSISDTKQRPTGPKLVELLINDAKICRLTEQILNQSQCESVVNKSKKTKYDSLGLFYEFFISWCVVKNLFSFEFHFTPYNTICYVVPGSSGLTMYHEDLTHMIYSIDL